MFTPDQKIQDRLKNVEPEIADYVRKLEAIIAEFERDKILVDSRITDFEENIKKLLSKQNVHGEISDSLRAAIAAAQGKVLRPKGFE